MIMSLQSRNRQRHNEQAKRIVEILRDLGDTDSLYVGTLSKEDIIGRYTVIEHKGKKQIPKWLSSAYQQTRPKDDGKIRAITLHEHGTRHYGDFVFLKAKDFFKLLAVWIKNKEKK